MLEPKPNIEHPNEAGQMDSAEALVRCENVTQIFTQKRSFRAVAHRSVRAVDGVSLQIFPAETLALVGESGCGKTTFAKVLLRLQAPSSGEVFFQNTNLTALSARKMRAWRSKMQLVFQNPTNSLNPRRTVYQTLAEAMRLGESGQRGTKPEVLELLEQVGLPQAALHRYPHAFSGGQKQRIAIARALAVHPHFVVCDEAVSALDTSVQLQILRLLRELQHRYGIAYLFITHNLSVARYIADRIAVMYRGRVVEIAPPETLWRAPLHPYTRALLASSPRLALKEERKSRAKLPQVVSEEEDSTSEGCGYAAACPHANEVCRQLRPRLRTVHDSEVACHEASA